MNPDHPTLQNRPTSAPIGWGRIISHLIFGICLSAFTLGFEIFTGFSDEIYINPIPSLFHAALVALVPLILAWNLFRCARSEFVRPWELHLNSVSIAISMVYTVIYLPIAPFAAVGVIVYGLGLLPLSPLIALFSAYRLRRELKRRLLENTPLRWRHFLTGFSIGLSLLAMASLPRIATDYTLAQYIRADNNDKNPSIQRLRTFGSEKVLLKACYRRAQPVFFWGQSARLETAEARRLYYRVTGKSFNQSRSEPKRFWTMRGGSSFDRDLGGEHVGQRIDQIHLQESRLDGRLDPSSGSGYVEWTMVFRNDDQRQQHEARMLLSMPKGGVASRVTLWVNDEPREAAFGSKAKVRAAYQSVAVRQRRDPVLVNWAGPDLLLVQCFPIQPNGGEMKIRIGISFPLEVDGGTTLRYRYPAIVAENFNISEQMRHAVWYEEKFNGAMQSHPVVDLSHQALQSERRQLRQSSQALMAKFNSSLPTQSGTDTLKPELPTDNVRTMPQAIVVDGSRNMRPQLDRIATWLESRNETFQLFLASDDVQHFQGTGAVCAQWLRAQKFIGGQDNVPALIEAIRILQQVASAKNPQSLYWFSGAQPVQLSGTEKIQQLFERRALHVEIVACLTSRDYNAVYELAPLSYCDRLYLDANGKLSQSTLRFNQTEQDQSASKGSSHSQRVWLSEQIRIRAQKTYQQQALLGPSQFRAKMTEIADRAATAYLVTQLSGAVVLETDQQYKENDLEPGDPNQVPTVPEYKHFALIMGLSALTWMLGRRRRQSR